jgi:hydroxyethylthiazole kinase-like sugar kinase family protein
MTATHPSDTTIRPFRIDIPQADLDDLVTVGLDSVRLAGTHPADAVDHLVFAATAADVTSVITGGRQVVRDGHHLLVADVPAALTRAIAAADHRRGDRGHAAPGC